MSLKPGRGNVTSLKPGNVNGRRCYHYVFKNCLAGTVNSLLASSVF